MREALLKLFSSAKTWTAFLGMIATAGASLLARYGLELSDEAIQQIAITISGLFATLLVTQGLADHGKEQAKIQAASSAVLARELGERKPEVANQTVVVQAPVSGEVSS